MLYWAEGSKSRNGVQFVNSDPAMVRYFVEFLRTHYEVPDEAIRVASNLFADHAERQYEIERFWLDALSTARRNARTDSHTERCGYASTRHG